MIRITSTEIEKLYDEMVDFACKNAGDSSPQANFNEGVKAALGWVLGYEDKPET